MMKSKTKIFYKFVITGFGWFFKTFYRLKVYGLNHFEKGGGVIAANHTSYYDPPLLAATWPEEIHFLAKEDLFKRKLLGPIITALNAHPVNGSAKDATIFKLIDNLIKDEKKVMLFPEGTRSFKDRLGPIKRGVALILAKSESRVIPVYIHGAYDIWNRKKRFPKFKGTLAVIYGSPIYWEEFSHLGEKEAQSALIHSIQQSINDLRAWYEDGAEGSPP